MPHFWNDKSTNEHDRGFARSLQNCLFSSGPMGVALPAERLKGFVAKIMPMSYYEQQKGWVHSVMAQSKARFASAAIVSKAVEHEVAGLLQNLEPDPKSGEHSGDKQLSWLEDMGCPRFSRSKTTFATPQPPTIKNHSFQVQRDGKPNTEGIDTKVAAAKGLQAEALVGLAKEQDCVHRLQKGTGIVVPGARMAVLFARSNNPAARCVKLSLLGNDALNKISKNLLQAK